MTPEHADLAHSRMAESVDDHDDPDDCIRQAYREPWDDAPAETHGDRRRR